MRLVPAYRDRPSPLHAARAGVTAAFCAALALVRALYPEPARARWRPLAAILAAGVAAGVGGELRRALLFSLPLALLDRDRQPARLPGGRHPARARRRVPRPAHRHHARGARRRCAGRAARDGVHARVRPVLGLRRPRRAAAGCSGASRIAPRSPRRSPRGWCRCSRATPSGWATRRAAAPSRRPAGGDPGGARRCARPRGRRGRGARGARLLGARQAGARSSPPVVAPRPARRRRGCCDRARRLRPPPSRALRRSTEYPSTEMRLRRRRGRSLRRGPARGLRAVRWPWSPGWEWPVPDAARDRRSPSYRYPERDAAGAARRLARARAGYLHRPRGNVGLGQVDAAACALRPRAALPRRRGAGRAERRRPRRARPRPGRAGRGVRHRLPGSRVAGGDGRRPRRAVAAARAPRRVRRRRSRARWRRSRSRSASRTCSTAAPTRFPAASCSASRSPPRWSHRPALLLLDEPTSQLDPVAGDELIWLLRRLNEEWGTAVVIAEHRLERCLPAADRVRRDARRRGRLRRPTRATFLAWATADAPALATPVAPLVLARRPGPAAGIGQAGARSSCARPALPPTGPAPPAA